MKLNQFKNRVYVLWGNSQQRRGERFLHSLPSADSVFKQAIRRYGDLRKLPTWKAAFVDLLAEELNQEMLFEGQFLIEELLCNCPSREGWLDLVGSVVERLFGMPSAVRALAVGIHSIAVNGIAYDASLEQIRQLFNPDQRDFLRNYAQIFKQPTREESLRIRG